MASVFRHYDKAGNLLREILHEESIAAPRRDRPVQQSKRAIQPGNLLALSIRKITNQSAGNCACKSRQSQMNEWGWLGCWRNRKIIMAWLAEEAAKRGHQIPQAEIGPLFLAAWRELRSK